MSLEPGADLLHDPLCGGHQPEDDPGAPIHDDLPVHQDLVLTVAAVDLFDLDPELAL